MSVTMRARGSKYRAGGKEVLYVLYGVGGGFPVGVKARVRVVVVVEIPGWWVVARVRTGGLGPISSGFRRPLVERVVTVHN